MNSQPHGEGSWQVLIAVLLQMGEGVPGNVGRMLLGFTS